MRLLVLILLFSSAGFAENFLSHRSLGAACSAVRNVRIDPACNPAFLARVQEEEEDGVLAAQLFLGDTYKYFYKNRDLFDDKNKRTLIEDILSQDEPVGFQGGAQLWWKQPGLVVGIQPMRLQYYSEVQNSAYPDIFVEGVYEQSIFFQFAKQFTDTTSLGLQIRLLDRQVIAERFYLFDALPQLDDYFQVKRQKAILLEPGMAWDLGDESHTWNPALSFKVSQTGYVDRKITEVPITKPILDFGASIAPAALDEQLELALNYRANSERTALENISLGTSLSLRVLQIYLGLEKDTQSFGLSSRFRNWSSGFIYQKTRSVLSREMRDISYLEFRILI